VLAQQETPTQVLLAGVEVIRYFLQLHLQEVAEVAPIMVVTMLVLLVVVVVVVARYQMQQVELQLRVDRVMLVALDSPMHLLFLEPEVVEVLEQLVQIVLLKLGVMVELV
tara:strand:+ start:187 stop:516 length:330 start_codon:yes stop_codon:yes gene_type:complete